MDKCGQAVRLIDANNIIADLEAMKTQYDAISLDGLIRGIERQPTVDAVPVVRCRECKHSEDVPVSADSTLYCLQWDTCTSKDGYCHKGRKDDGGSEDDR